MQIQASHLQVNLWCIRSNEYAVSFTHFSLENFLFSYEKWSQLLMCWLHQHSKSLTNISMILVSMSVLSDATNRKLVCCNNRISHLIHLIKFCLNISALKSSFCKDHSSTNTSHIIMVKVMIITIQKSTLNQFVYNIINNCEQTQTS